MNEISHGGFISALIDITTGQGVKRILADGRSLVTVTNTVEYLRSARVGERLRLDVSVEHSTDRLVFASCRVTVETKAVAIASSVFSTR